MALSASTVFEINSGATASNVNGGGFNPTNTHGVADGVIASGTGNSPTLTSATYTFAAGDVGAWVYFPAQTNMTAGWYQIASQTGGVATLSAVVGAAIQVANNRYIPNTVAGCATTAAPTGVTFLVDYSQNTAAVLTNTDLTSTAASTTVTSLLGTFTPVMVGNLIHLTALTGTGAIVGWYEIVQYTDAHNVILDRTPTNGVNNITAGTYFVGGALSLGSSDDAVFELAVSSTTAATRYFIKGGSSIVYNIGGTVSISAAANTVWPVIVEAYATLRGDRPTGATRPTFNLGATQITWGANWDKYCLITTSTAATAESGGANGKSVDCKCFNSSTTAGRTAYGAVSTYTYIRCEGISMRGNAFNLGSQTANFIGCYAHDSDKGIVASTGAITVQDSIIANNVTSGISTTGADVGLKIFINNTLYGAENKLGLGLTLASGTTNTIFLNNIIYGFTTGVTHADTQTVCYDNYNNYFNNTADVSSSVQWQKGPNDIALNPGFTNVAQLTGSTATTSGSVLTQSGADFSSVTDNVDFVYIVSGTGITAGKYLITSHTGTTLTLNAAPGTSAVADKVWQITTNHNFGVGTNMKATGTPGVFPGGLTTGYIDIGAAQRQEPIPTNTGTTTSYAYA